MQGKSGYYLAQGATIGVLVLLGFTAAGCEVIGDIFKAGIWVGIIIVAAVVFGIMLLLRMFKS